MFTVNIKSKGFEVTKSAKSVSYHEGGKEMPRHVLLHRDGEVAENVFKAKVFVMNEKGATVAKYELDGSPIQESYNPNSTVLKSTNSGDTA